MAKQVQKQTAKTETKAAEEVANKPQDVQNAELGADVADILDEIDSVLEAQFDFAIQYVQQGGQ